MVGGCLVKHWAKTQTTISLSSGKSEFHGIANGMARALGIQSLMNDMGWKLPVTVHSDATAAIGIARRKGLGKIRHLDVTDLWIQDKVRSKSIGLKKVLGADNPADMFYEICRASHPEQGAPSHEPCFHRWSPSLRPYSHGSITPEHAAARDVQTAVNKNTCL